MFIKISLLKEALMNHATDACHALSKTSFTKKQGQYLAFIYAYTRVMSRPPAEADMQRHFQVTPPTVHQMVLTLERTGLIQRQPRQPRSIQLLVAPEHLPILR
jgi:DNA-binding MarR family transcriptional regulator